MLKRLTNRVLWEIGKVPFIRERNEARRLMKWLSEGKLGPAPHLVKQANLRRLARLFQVDTIVETGTFRADMLYALREDFKFLISVELSKDLYEYARDRCARFSNIQIRNGDSATELREICARLSGRTIFWLDGHYSGGDTALGDVTSPIIEELNAIKSRKEIEPIIVIDDAWLFVEGTGYPLLSEIFSHFQSWDDRNINISIHDDAIVAIPQGLLSEINNNSVVSNKSITS